MTGLHVSQSDLVEYQNTYPIFIGQVGMTRFSQFEYVVGVAELSNGSWNADFSGF